MGEMAEITKTGQLLIKERRLSKSGRESERRKWLIACGATGELRQ